MTFINDGNFTFSRKPVNQFVKGLQSNSKYDDPTYLGFTLLFDWYTPLEHTHTGGSPLLAGSVNESVQGSEPENWNTIEGTALDYLKYSGEYKRMQYLNTFINTLKRVNSEMPWFWQTIVGIENLWSSDYLGKIYEGGEESVITINTLENIELIATRLMALYRAAMFDRKYRRAIVPENLRKFTVHIYVQELRKFQVEKDLMENIMGDVPMPGNTVTDKIDAFFNVDNPDILRINDNSSKIIFSLTYCEFLAGKSSEIYSELTNTKPEPASQSVSFNWVNCGISTGFSDVEFITNSTGSGSFDEWKNSLQANAKEMAKQKLLGAAEKAKGYVNKLMLGNVHGFSAGDFALAMTEANIQSMSRQASNMISSIDNSSNTLTGNENVHGSSERSNNSLTNTENVHDSINGDLINSNLSGNENVHLSSTSNISNTILTGKENIHK